MAKATWYRCANSHLAGSFGVTTQGYSLVHESNTAHSSGHSGAHTLYVNKFRVPSSNIIALSVSGDGLVVGTATANPGGPAGHGFDPLHCRQSLESQHSHSSTTETKSMVSFSPRTDSIQLSLSRGDLFCQCGFLVLVLTKLYHSKQSPFEGPQNHPP